MFGFISKIDDLGKTIIKYDLEEYFEIAIQIKVVDLKKNILSIWLDPLILSPIFFYKF